MLNHRIASVLGVVVCMAAALPSAIQAQAADALSDAQIAHIAVTANAIDIELGELAGRRANDARVREFAARMVTDHTGVNEAAAALAARLRLTPEDNAVSRSLREDAEEAKGALNEAEGTAFDRAYMEREAAYHRTVLEALDDVLIPGARNAELRALLEQARGAVAAHLEHAERLRDALVTVS